jgi:hypothetical protein
MVVNRAKPFVTSVLKVILKRAIDAASSDINFFHGEMPPGQVAGHGSLADSERTSLGDRCR